MALMRMECLRTRAIRAWKYAYTNRDPIHSWQVIAVSAKFNSGLFEGTSGDTSSENGGNGEEAEAEPRSEAGEKDIKPVGDNEPLDIDKNDSAVTLETKPVERRNLHVLHGQQGKHIKGHKNYIEGRSILYGSISDAQALVNEFAGHGIIHGTREVVDTKRIIGEYVDRKTGLHYPTTRITIHYGNSGVHVVPARPNELLKGI